MPLTTEPDGTTPDASPLDAALAKIREDGTYDAVYTEWFGELKG